MRFRLVFGTLLVAATAASSDPRMEANLIGLLDSYATSAGNVAACEPGLTVQIEELALVIAEWRHSGLWAWLTGAQADYADVLTADAMSTFRQARSEGCFAMTASGFQMVMDAVPAQIERGVATAY